jgi:hypothetical protein
MPDATALEVVFVLAHAAADDVDIGRELTTWLLTVAFSVGREVSDDLIFSAVWHVHDAQVVTVTATYHHKSAKVWSAALEGIKSALGKALVPSHVPRPLAVFVEPLGSMERQRSVLRARSAASPARAALAECGWMQRPCRVGAPCVLRAVGEWNESSAFAVCLVNYDVPEAALARCAAKWVADALARVAVDVPGAWRCRWLVDASLHILTVVARFEATTQWESATDACGALPASPWPNLRDSARRIW